jgi:hypothetical protein
MFVVTEFLEVGDGRSVGVRIGKLTHGVNYSVSPSGQLPDRPFCSTPSHVEQREYPEPTQRGGRGHRGYGDPFESKIDWWVVIRKCCGNTPVSPTERGLLAFKKNDSSLVLRYCS